MKSFILGKYLPYDSWIHRLDPRLKIITTILLMVAVFLNYESWAMIYLMAGILFLIISVLLWSTHMRISTVLRSLRSMWFMVVFLLVIYILVPNEKHVLPVAWSINGWTVYWDSFAEAGRILVRLILMVMLTMILTASTKPLDLTYALEWFMAPLKAIHFPAAEIAMTVSIALRFIPTLLEDAGRIMKAQASRGVDFESKNVFARIPGIISLIVPLFVSSFMRSEELANAMECRAYDPQGERTKYRILHFHLRDLFAFIGAASLMGVCIAISATNFDLFAFIGGFFK